MLTINEIQDACKLIEVDGLEAQNTVSRRYGFAVSQLLVTFHLRQTRISKKALPGLQEALGLIENINPDQDPDGHLMDAYRAVALKLGDAIAQLLIIAHLRRKLGSMNTHPPDPKIDAKVEIQLALGHIYSKFTFRRKARSRPR